jgi:hypothetical protein
MSEISAKEQRKKRTENIKKSIELGVSFSVKTCNDYGVDWQACLQSLLDAGIKRFRIMSYWDLHQPNQQAYDWDALDKQLEIISSRGASATLCIGMRQPRWPETHVPQWALDLDVEARTSAYLVFHQAVIDRYKESTAIESWQLENEFWNKSFGLNNTFSRKRLVTEFKMLRVSDPTRPIIMSLGNTVGYPLFAPKPDLFGTTIYLVQFEKGRYSPTKYSPLYFRVRSWLVRLIGWRSLIIHELQAEPWGPKANWEMDDQEQARSMDSEQLKKCVAFARKSGIKYADLWGGEWWYWRKTTQKDVALWTTVKNEVTESRHYV